MAKEGFTNQLTPESETPIEKRILKKTELNIELTRVAATLDCIASLVCALEREVKHTLLVLLHEEGGSDGS